MSDDSGRITPTCDNSEATQMASSVPPNTPFKMSPLVQDDQEINAAVSSVISEIVDNTASSPKAKPSNERLAKSASCDVDDTGESSKVPHVHDKESSILAANVTNISHSDIISALEALTIEADETNETFTSCQDDMEESIVTIEEPLFLEGESKVADVKTEEASKTDIQKTDNLEGAEKPEGLVFVDDYFARAVVDKSSDNKSFIVVESNPVEDTELSDDDSPVLSMELEDMLLSDSTKLPTPPKVCPKGTVKPFKSDSVHASAYDFTTDDAEGYFMLDYGSDHLCGSHAHTAALMEEILFEVDEELSKKADVKSVASIPISSGSPKSKTPRKKEKVDEFQEAFEEVNLPKEKNFVNVPKLEGLASRLVSFEEREARIRAKINRKDIKKTYDEELSEEVDVESASTIPVSSGGPKSKTPQKKEKVDVFQEAFEEVNLPKEKKSEDAPNLEDLASRIVPIAEKEAIIRAKINREDIKKMHDEVLYDTSIVASVDTTKSEIPDSTAARMEPFVPTSKKSKEINVFENAPVDASLAEESKSGIVPKLDDRASIIKQEDIKNPYDVVAHDSPTVTSNEEIKSKIPDTEVAEMPPVMQTSKKGKKSSVFEDAFVEVSLSEEQQESGVVPNLDDRASIIAYIEKHESSTQGNINQEDIKNLYDVVAYDSPTVASNEEIKSKIPDTEVAEMQLVMQTSKKGKKSNVFEDAFVEVSLSEEQQESGVVPSLDDRASIIAYIEKHESSTQGNINPEDIKNLYDVVAYDSPTVTSAEEIKPEIPDTEVAKIDPVVPTAKRSRKSSVFEDNFVEISLSEEQDSGNVPNVNDHASIIAYIEERESFTQLDVIRTEPEKMFDIVEYKSPSPVSTEKEKSTTPNVQGATIVDATVPSDALVKEQQSQKLEIVDVVQVPEIHDVIESTSIVEHEKSATAKLIDQLESVKLFDAVEYKSSVALVTEEQPRAPEEVVIVENQGIVSDKSAVIALGEKESSELPKIDDAKSSPKILSGGEESSPQPSDNVKYSQFSHSRSSKKGQTRRKSTTPNKRAESGSGRLISILKRPSQITPKSKELHEVTIENLIDFSSPDGNRPQPMEIEQLDKEEMERCEKHISNLSSSFTDNVEVLISDNVTITSHEKSEVIVLKRPQQSPNSGKTSPLPPSEHKPTPSPPKPKEFKTTPPPKHREFKTSPSPPKPREFKTSPSPPKPREFKTSPSPPKPREFKTTPSPPKRRDFKITSSPPLAREYRLAPSPTMSREYRSSGSPPLAREYRPAPSPTMSREYRSPGSPPLPREHHIWTPPKSTKSTPSPTKSQGKTTLSPNKPKGGSSQSPTKSPEVKTVAAKQHQHISTAELNLRFSNLEACGIKVTPDLMRDTPSGVRGVICLDTFCQGHFAEGATAITITPDMREKIAYQLENDPATPLKVNVADETVLVDYDTVMASSPSLFDEKAAKFKTQADLKLKINELHQTIAVLKLALREKEGTIIKLEAEAAYNNQYHESELAMWKKRLSEGNPTSCQYLMLEETVIKTKEALRRSEKKFSGLEKKSLFEISALKKALMERKVSESRLTELYATSEVKLAKAQEEIEICKREKLELQSVLAKLDVMLEKIACDYNKLKDDHIRLQKNHEGLTIAFNKIVEKYEYSKFYVKGASARDSAHAEEVKKLTEKIEALQEKIANMEAAAAKESADE